MASALSSSPSCTAACRALRWWLCALSSDLLSSATSRGRSVCIRVNNCEDARKGGPESLLGAQGRVHTRPTIPSA
eukprot:4476872-Pleurochrysis_carterae.AAC.2